MLGGYAAEEIIFGEVTTGSSNDLERASQMTISMVSRYGMGEAFGLLAVADDDRHYGFSQRTTYAAESEARDLVNAARATARQVLSQHRAEMEALASRLLEVETVEADELVELLGPAVTTSPRPKQPVDLAPLAPARAVRATNRSPRRKAGERMVGMPAAIIASAMSLRRRRVPGHSAHS
jgi:cell division protease FtsH